MRKIAAVLLLTVALTSYAQTRTLAGSYTGPDASYGLVLEIAADGKLIGNYVDAGHVAVLHAIEVKGEKFTARASFDDGSLRMITGSVTAKGIRIADTFFERM